MKGVGNVLSLDLFHGVDGSVVLTMKNENQKYIVRIRRRKIKNASK